MGKYLDIIGVQHLWNKVKTRISDYVNGHKDIPNGIAGLDSLGKLNPSTIDGVLKTINNQSLVGNGNITLDLSLYNVVQELPTDNIDPNKIYLVLSESESSAEGNIYTEYVYIAEQNKYEELGKYKSNVDLTPYVTFDDTVTSYKNGLIAKEAAQGFLITKVVNETNDGLYYGTLSPGTGAGNSIHIPFVTETSGGMIPKRWYKGLISALALRGSGSLGDNGYDIPMSPIASWDANPSMKFTIPYASITQGGLITNEDKKILKSVNSSNSEVTLDLTIAAEGFDVTTLTAKTPTQLTSFVNTIVNGHLSSNDFWQIVVLNIYRPTGSSAISILRAPCYMRTTPSGVLFLADLLYNNEIYRTFFTINPTGTNLNAILQTKIGNPEALTEAELNEILI